MELIIVALIQSAQVVLLAHLAKRQHKQSALLSSAIHRTLLQLQIDFPTNTCPECFPIISAFRILAHELSNPSTNNGR